MAGQTQTARLPGGIWTGRFAYEAETVLYLVLSLADLMMTYFLLVQNLGNLEFVESNPVAQAFLNHWGIRGMIYFKFAMVGIVCVVTQIIARYRPFTARLLLWFAIVVMIYVLFYSVRLYQSHALSDFTSGG